MNDIDIRRLDFTLLLVFREMLLRRKTTAVAEKLALSQSAISHALARLRDIFHDQLFERRANGLQPTEVALRLGETIEAILVLATDALNGSTSFDPRQTRRVFRIAANDYVASLLVPALRQRLADEAPDARLSIRFAVGAEAQQALRRDEIDLAVGRFVSLGDDVRATYLGTEKYLVARRTSAQATAEPLDLATYLALNHVLVSFRGDFRGTVDTALARIGAERRVTLSVPMFLTAFTLAQNSALAVTAPARLTRAFAHTFGLSVSPPPFAIEPFDVAIAGLARKADEPGLHWLTKQIRKTWDSLDGCS
ncbi:MAG: LysR substrate-binding domain-containing protein [Propionivibrio sp.]